MPFLINLEPVSYDFFVEQLKSVCFSHVQNVFDIQINHNHPFISSSGLTFTTSSFVKANHSNLYYDHLDIFYNDFLNEALISINVTGSYFVENTLFQMTEELEPVRWMETK